MKDGALWAQPRFECGKCDGVFAYDYAQLHICDYAQLKNFFSQNTHSTAWKFWHLWHILHFVMNPYKKLSIYWLLTFFKRVKCLKANVKLVPLRVQVRPWGGSLRPGGPPARQKGEAPPCQWTTWTRAKDIHQSAVHLVISKTHRPQIKACVWWHRSHSGSIVEHGRASASGSLTDIHWSDPIVPWSSVNVSLVMWHKCCAA